jgi:hypothetical protein
MQKKSVADERYGWMKYGSPPTGGFSALQQFDAHEHGQTADLLPSTRHT